MKICFNVCRSAQREDGHEGTRPSRAARMCRCLSKVFSSKGTDKPGQMVGDGETGVAGAGCIVGGAIGLVVGSFTAQPGPGLLIGAGVGTVLGAGVDSSV